MKRPSMESALEEDDDVEMASLGDVIRRPALPNGNGSKITLHENDSEDEDFGQDEGSRALLGPQEWPRGRERTLSKLGSVWLQSKNIVIECAPTLLLTTVGLLFTGKLLDRVSRWRAMREIDQLIMIIPVILNLKGNLEMNLSARLGTAANVGELDTPSTRRSMIIGNLTLLQVQATVVSFVAACVSLILGLIVPRINPSKAPPSNSTNTSMAEPATIFLRREVMSAVLHYSRRPLPSIPPSDESRKSGFTEFVMVASTAMTAACLSSLILGSFMCGLIVLCRRFGRDPDNIAPPVASCLGDLVTLFLLGLVSTVLIPYIHTPVPFVVGTLIVLSAISCAVFTRGNKHVRDLLFQGWSPLFGAMVISSGTGIVLDLFVSRYEGFALLAVVISGLPGSVGAIFVSRLSTALHAAALSLPSASMLGSDKRIVEEASPRLVMTTLLLITLPVEIIFLTILHALGWLRLPFMFVALSVVFFCCAVTASLFIARFLTNFLWSRQLDPDMYALPIHSALMDLIGQLLLVLCFEIVSLLGARVSSKAGG